MGGDNLKIALIPGDGIGPEVVSAAHQVLERGLAGSARTVEYVTLDAGWETFQRTGNALPHETLEALRTCDGALVGAVSSPSHKVDGYSSPIIGMRRALELYANLRPIQSAPIETSRPGVDMLIVRENTEGLYVKQERLEDDGNRAVADRVITRQASERIVRTAFEQAASRNAHNPADALVTIVHKANVLRTTDGLFREAALNVAAGYPAIAHEEQLVDSMAYRMILEPERYDVVVAPNLYGDILSDAAAALVGGLGLIPSANVGDDFVLAEPVHGSAPDIAGQGIANPIAAIRAGALLLEMVGESGLAYQIQDAVNTTLAEGPTTKDLGGHASTQEVTDAIIAQLGSAQKSSPISIRQVEPMLPTRPCKYCLSLQDDSVFADFDVDSDNRVYLVRISFDGYGCCRVEDTTRKMNPDDSRAFVDAVTANAVNRNPVRSILNRYFQENQDIIWKDALEAHNLIN